ncbi:MAG: glycosyltransferase 87 family protein [Anaerolineales bacterium]
MDRNKKIYVLSFVIVVGFVYAVAFHYVQGFYKGLPYPNNTFLFTAQDRFSDFFDVLRDGHTLNPYLGYQSAQYPFLAVVGYLFSLIPNNTYVIYICIFCASFLFFNFAFLSIGNLYASATHIFIITFLSYPFLFALDRGNFESLLFILLLAFTFFYTKKHYLASAIILAFAISMKIYPAILLVLFIPEKKYHEAAVCAISTIVITLASLLCFKGGLFANLSFLMKGSNIGSNWMFTHFVSIESNLVQRGVSLLTFIKIISFETGLLPGFLINHFSSFYMGLAVFLGVLAVTYVIFVEKEEWKRFALLIFAMLLLPSISADYKLLHVFIPLYVFINNKEVSKSDMIYLLMFCLLLIPKDYLYFTSVVSDYLLNRVVHDISISVFINILIMLLMSAIIMISGIRIHILNLLGKTHPVVD